MNGSNPLHSVPTEPDGHPGVFDDIQPGLRIKSRDYGTGTVVAVLGIGIQIHWDKVLMGSVNTHLLVHDKAYVAKLERL
jgi:hypothetical protein